MASAKTLNSHGTGIEKSGFLWKQGGSYRNWKKRYFVLRGSRLEYYKSEEDSFPKGSIDLTKGRGVRTKDQCDLKWPDMAKLGRCFGLAVETRTYFLYGEDQVAIRDWMTTLQRVIGKDGHPTDDYENDPEGKPEGKASKVAKKSAKIAAKVTKKLVKESGIANFVNKANIVKGVTDMLENQAAAADRFKMAGSDVAGLVEDNVTNQCVSVAANAAPAGQCNADKDDDVNVAKRLLLAGANKLEGAAVIVGVHSKITGDAISTAASITRDQVEADTDMSIKQRLILAGGSTLEGVSEIIDDEILAGTLEVAGGVVKDQAVADTDSSLKDRVLMAVGSVANGGAELDSVKHNYIGQAIAREVGKGAEKVEEILKDNELTSN